MIEYIVYTADWAMSDDPDISKAPEPINEIDDRTIKEYYFDTEEAAIDCVNSKLREIDKWNAILEIRKVETIKTYDLNKFLALK